MKTFATLTCKDMQKEKALTSSISISIWKAGLVFLSVFPLAAQATSISPSCPTATSIPATNLRRIRSFIWGTYGKASSVPR